MEYLLQTDACQSLMCSCCHFHFTPKLVIYHSLSCLLPLFWSTAAEPCWIIQWRPMGRESQTVLSCYSKHSHCEWKVIKPGNTKRAFSLTAFNWFVIKTLSLDRSEVTFSTVPLLMLLLRFTRRSIAIVSQAHGTFKARKVLSLHAKYLFQRHRYSLSKWII